MTEISNEEKKEQENRKFELNSENRRLHRICYSNANKNTKNRKI